MLTALGILCILGGIGEIIYGMWGIYMYYKTNKCALYNMKDMWILIGILMIMFGIFFVTGLGGLI